MENSTGANEVDSITFLYKLVQGGCPKSYGFNAAKLAGIGGDVVKQAHDKANEFELNVLAEKTAHTFQNGQFSAAEALKLLIKLKSLMI